MRSDHKAKSAKHADLMTVDFSTAICETSKKYALLRNILESDLKKYYTPHPANTWLGLNISIEF